MANRYVWSGASGAGTGADWANAFTTLSAAFTGGAAGDTYYVASDHAHNYGASTTLGFRSGDRVLSVNRAGSVPPVAADLLAGALEGTNAASTNLTVEGSIYCWGVTWAPGSGQSTACSFTAGTTNNRMVFDNCQFHLLSTNSGNRINFANNAACRVLVLEPRFKFSATGQSVRNASGGGRVEIVGPSSASILASGSSVPTTLVTASNTATAGLTFTGSDLSDISGTLVGTLVGNAGKIRFINCRLHASVTVTGTPSNPPSGGVELIGCHSTTNAARNEVYHPGGTLTTETTIKRTAGASDGTTSYSHKIVTNSAASRQFPFECFEGAVMNTDTGSSKTLTMHCVTDNVTLKDDEIWIEVEYLGSSSYPITTRISDTPATILTAGSNQASDSGEAWTTTGLTTPVKQKLECTFTPQMAGPIRWRVKVGKPSTTVYVCPKADLS